MKSNKYFLIGMMGTGKSKVGQLLANLLPIECIDTDKWIENKHGSTIKNIFENKGEEAFRTIEKEALTQICKTQHPLIIATGGGMPCFHDNMTFMKNNGITFYLESSIPELAQRLKSSKNKRPILENSPEDLETKLQSILNLREKTYQLADYRINANQTQQEVAEDIYKIITELVE